jgi:hypothetical protein
MSLRGHQATFDRYPGTRFEITSTVSFEPPSPVLINIVSKTQSPGTHLIR